MKLDEIGPVVSQEQSFENVDRRRTGDLRNRLESFRGHREVKHSKTKIQTFTTSNILTKKRQAEELSGI